MDVLTSRAGSKGVRKPQRFLGFCSVIVCALRLSAPALGAAEQSIPLEYQVKAAFLLNFTKFVEWPTDGFTDRTAPVTICIDGDTPVVLALDQMLEGELVGNRKVVMLRSPPDPAKSCQVLFIGKAEHEAAKLIANAGRNVLTVGESDRFLSDGGMINFVIDNRRVRFDINQNSVANSALKLSSKLFSVARRVEK